MTDAKTKTYQEALSQARKEFEAATKRIEEIELETMALNDDVAKLRRTITALAAMCSEAPGFDDLGITDMCMEVMEQQRGEVTTADVVKALGGLGFDVTSQQNVAASVHSVLSRMARRKKIEKVGGDGTGVTWRGPNFDPNYDPNDIPF